MIPVDSDLDGFGPAPLAGVEYRGPMGVHGRWSFAFDRVEFPYEKRNLEAGFEVLAVRGDYLFYLGERLAGLHLFKDQWSYAMAGVGYAHGHSSGTAPGRVVKSYDGDLGIIEIGRGIEGRLTRLRQWDARLTYRVLFDGDGADGYVAVEAGITF
jgi:hypothetical protein